MIDIHSHIIYGIGDGVNSFDEAADMLVEAQKAGIKVIYATPCVQPGQPDNNKLKENLELLRLKAGSLDLTIKLGREVKLSPLLLKFEKLDKSLLLENSSYMLLELPLDELPDYSTDVVYNLQMSNVIPVLVHPERNRYFQRDFELLIDFIERGCLIQIDNSSILGRNGRKAKRIAKMLAKLKLVQFAASDARSVRDYGRSFLKAYRRLKRWTGEDYADIVYYKNPKMVMGG